jgi:hypothetical protein
MATAIVPRTLHIAVATPKNDMQRRMSSAGFNNFWVEVFGTTIANFVSRGSTQSRIQPG